MGKRRVFSREFNTEAVRPVAERGMKVSTASKDPGIHESVRARQDRTPLVHIRTSFEQSDRTYGRSSVRRDLDEWSHAMVADFRYLGTEAGWLHRAVVLDLFSRRVVAGR